MNSANGHQPHSVQANGAVPQKCALCGHSTLNHCFCRIHRDAADPILLCCPDCLVQYLDSATAPADHPERDLRACEKKFHFLMREETP